MIGREKEIKVGEVRDGDNPLAGQAQRAPGVLPCCEGLVQRLHFFPHHGGLREKMRHAINHIGGALSQAAVAL